MVQNGNFYVSQSEFWAYFYKHPQSDMLLRHPDAERESAIFNAFVNVIYLELSTACNRRCSYCPVSLYPRQDSHMDETIFRRIIQELKELDYRNTLSLSLYNEPLMDPLLKERVREIHRELPFCYIRFNSNGDYLTKELLDELCEIGVKELQITMQFAPNESYTDVEARSKLDRFFQKLGMDYAIKSMREGHNITVDFIYRSLRMLVLTNHWSVDGNSRGGLIDSLNSHLRKAPCAAPFREIAVDVDGKLRRCCNMYFTQPELRRVDQCSLKGFFFSDEMISLRKNLLLFRDKRISPCELCNTFDYAQNETPEKWNDVMSRRFFPENRSY